MSVKPSQMKLDQTVPFFQKHTIKILLWSIPLVFIISLLLKETSNFSLHDTYLVISNLHIGLLLATFQLLLIAIYWLYRKFPLIIKMVKLHVYLTCISLLIILISLFIQNYFMTSFQLKNQFTLIGIGIGLWLFAQIVLFFNIWIAIFRKILRT